MWRIITVSIVLFALMGCGSKSHSRGVIKGKITYKGQPVNGAVLHLYSTSDKDDSSDEDEGILVPVSQEGTFDSANIPPGEYKIVVTASEIPKEMGMPAVPKGMDPAKAAEMKAKFQQMQGEEKPTIPYPKKYKNLASTDLKCTIQKGEQQLDLELKD